MIESPETAEKLGLTRYESVQFCVYYPSEGKRPFSFKKDGAIESSYDDLVTALKEQSDSSQLDCLSESYEAGDEIYYFDKTGHGINEKGYVVLRNHIPVAVILTFAMYS